VTFRQTKRGATVLGLFWGLALAVSAAAQPQALERPPGSTAKQAASARHQMVATANPLATDAGLLMLRRGGSAVDAAIAAQMVLNLVEPQSSGIGGGALMLVHDPRRKSLVAYDGRETAPAAARPDRFLDRNGSPLHHFDAVVGGRSVGVPGTLRMLELAHRSHGRLDWATLFDPAIRLAENGFVVSRRLSGAIAAERYLRQDRARSYFLNPDGTPLAVGQQVKNPAFAATLKRVAAKGAEAFYTGEIARDIVDTANGYAANPGDLTLADLASYRALARKPVCGRYRSYRVCGAPPPSSGGVAVLQILGMLERFDLRSLASSELISAHVFDEAGRLAYADRGAYIGDPDFFPVPAGLTDRSYLRERSQLIRLDASVGDARPGQPPPANEPAFAPSDDALEFPSTSHLSIVDRYGGTVAMTTTIEDAFGSRLMTAGGFLLNNELTDFNFVPKCPTANQVEGGKRPRSSMSPTIVYGPDGKVVLAVGAAGGSTIPAQVIKTIIGVLDFHLTAQDAVALPMIYAPGDTIFVESGANSLEAMIPQLRALGHGDIRLLPPGTFKANAIGWSNGRWIGGADPRSEGTAVSE
jgi:gamma-glutamyltranspeptidase/glutathione hydrolase